MHRSRLALTLTAAAAAGIGTAVRRAWRAPLASTALPATIRGITDCVQVDCDAWDIPFIRASSADDAWVVTGYLHAQHHWASMELMLRCADGTLEDVLGSSLRAQDRAMQSCSLRDRARREWHTLSPEARIDLTSYCRGVQAWLDSTPPNSRSLETRLSRRPMRVWTPVDSLLVLRLVALGWSGVEERPSGLDHFAMWDWAGATDPAVLSGDHGSRNTPLSNPDDAAMIIGDTPRIVGAARELRSAIRGARRMLGTDSPDRGSNAWAVQRRHTSTGAPILAADCHMEVAVPALWFEVGVRCPELSIRGFTIPGVPWVWSGHTGTAAWALTGCGTQQPSPNPESLTVLTSDTTCASALAHLQRASSSSAVSHALDAWHTPLVHVVHADENDMIGLRLCGDLSGGSSSLRPTATNPECGWIVSANDCAAGRSHPARSMLIRGAAPGWRAQRVRELLSRTSHGSVAHHAAMQLDVESVSARELRGMIVDRTTHGSAAPRSDAGQRLLAELRAWNGLMHVDARGAAAYVALTDVIRLVVGHAVRSHDRQSVGAGHARRIIGSHASSDHTPTSAQALMMFLHLIARADAMMIDQMCDIADVPHDSDSLISWMIDTAARRLPEDPIQWSLGSARATRIRHRWMHRGWLGRLPGLNRAASPGKAAMPGGCDTPWLTTSDEGVTVGPVFRMVIDLADPDQSVGVLAGGQSSHCASEHATDQLAMWISGAVRPMPWSDAAIDAAANTRCTIMPAPQTTETQRVRK